MVMQRSNYQDQFYATELPRLEALLESPLKDYPDFVGMIFDDRDSQAWGEQISSITGTGALVETGEGEDSFEDFMYEGFKHTVTHATYKLHVKYTRELIDDGKFNMVTRGTQALKKSVYHTRQVIGMHLLNNAFNSSVTYKDGKSLCATDHPKVTGGSQSNKSADNIGLSSEGLKQMEQSMGVLTDDRGIFGLIAAKKLVVNPALKHDLKVLLASTNIPGSANNDSNIYQNGYEAIVTPYLTSESNWFAVADNVDSGLVYFTRVAAEYGMDDKLKATEKCLIQHVYYRASATSESFEGVWGSEAA